jgi:hypothetical protein
MYRYRCDQCATTSPSVRTRVELDRERDRHRWAVHGGHIPDGERLQRSARNPASDRVAVLALAALAAVLLLTVVAGHLR